MSTTGSAAALRALLDQRIVVLDGAWGTMFQDTGLSSADYRGERLRDHPQDVTGDPDLLNLTRPDLVLEAHRAYLAAGADITRRTPSPPPTSASPITACGRWCGR